MRADKSCANFGFGIQFLDRIHLFLPVEIRIIILLLQSYNYTSDEKKSRGARNSCKEMRDR